MSHDHAARLMRERQADILGVWLHALSGREDAERAVSTGGEGVLGSLAEWATVADADVLRHIVRRPPWGDGINASPHALPVTTALHSALRTVSSGDPAADSEVDQFVMALSIAIAAELQTRDLRLQEMATADELTGVLNRRAVLEALDAEVSRALRHGRQLSVLYLDVDLLKEINDAMGHAAGDKVLLDVVSVVRRNTRASDRLGRMGGDEFVVVLPDTDQAGGAVVAEKLVRLITETGNSVSIGVAGSPRTPANRQKLIDAADEAMREAKSSGRRRYAVAW